MNSAYGRFALSTDPNAFEISCEEADLPMIHEFFDVIEMHQKADGYDVTVRVSDGAHEFMGIDYQQADHLIEEGQTFEDASRAARKVHERVTQALQDNRRDDLKVERNIAIASIITAYARLSLYSYLMSNPQVCYMDTDSVISKAGVNPIDEDGTILGKMKLENEVEEGWFAAPKLYSYKTPSGDEVFKAKGVNRLVRGDFSMQDIKNVVQEETPISATSEQWLRAKGMTDVTIRTITKNFSGANMKRMTVVNDAGEAVAYIPLTASEQIDGIHLSSPARVTEDQLTNAQRHYLELYRGIFARNIDPASLAGVDELSGAFTPHVLNQTELMKREPMEHTLEMDVQFFPYSKKENISEANLSIIEASESILESLNTQSFRKFRDGDPELVSAMEKDLRLKLRLLMRYCNNVDKMEARITQGVIPDYGISGVRADIARVMGRITRMWRQASRDVRAGVGEVGSAFDELENVFGWYFQLSQWIAANIRKGPADQRALELEAFRVIEGAGDSILKAQLFLISVMASEYKYEEITEVLDYLQPTLKLIITKDQPAFNKKALQNLANPRVEKFSKSMKIRIIAAVEAIFGPSADWKRLNNLPAGEFQRYVFGKQAMLPMVCPPNDFEIVKRSNAGVPILPEGNKTPYFQVPSKAIHSSHSSIQACGSEASEDSLNYASRVKLAIADRRVFNEYAFIEEVRHVSGPSRADAASNSFQLMQALQQRSGTDKGFYTPAFIDYRGRMYYYSMVNPQSFNMVRGNIRMHSAGSQTTSDMLPQYAISLMSDLGVKGSIIDKLLEFRHIWDAAPALYDHILMGRTAELYEAVRELRAQRGYDVEATFTLINAIPTIVESFRIIKELASAAEEVGLGQAELTGQAATQIMYSDAAQSGAQIISLMTDDDTLQGALGIAPQRLSTWENDYYTTIADFINNAADDQLEAVLVRANSHARRVAGRVTITLEDAQALRGRITRKIVKRNTMTIAYNLSQYGAIEQLREDFPLTTLSNVDICLLAPLISDAVDSLYPSIKSFMGTASEEVSRAEAEGRLPLLVTDCVTTHVDIRKTQSIKVGASSVKVPTEEVDYRAINNGFAPNVIHSIDGQIVHFFQIMMTAAG